MPNTNGILSVMACIGGLGHVLLLLSLQTLPVLSTGGVNLDSLLAPRVTDFKLSLHRRLEGSRIRNKRNILNPLLSEDYQMRVGSSEEVDLEYLSQYQLTFWIPVTFNYQNQVLIGTQDGYLMLFELTDADDKIGRMIANSTQGEIASKAMAFTHLDDQWFAVLHSSGESSWIRVYKRLGRGLEMRQVINLEGDADFDMVKVKNVHYLAVVTFKTTPAQPGFSLYQWTKTQLDEIAVRQVYGARSVASWVLDGTLYFAVAQEFNENGNFAAGSPIFMFNSKEESDLVFRQMLSTYGPKKVLHFYVGGGHYIIFIGRYEASIYWWANDQFLLFQTINGTAYASDVATLVLESGDVVIVIALREEALFLTLDDSGQYVVPYSAKFTGLDLVSLQFMYSGEAFYFLPLFAVSRPHRFSKLTLRPYYMPSGSSLDTLRQCVKDVFEILDQRQGELNNHHDELSRVWLKDKTQNITTDVIIAGNTSSIQATIITEVLVLIDVKLPPESSLSYVENVISFLMSHIDGVHQNIGQSVLKSTKQDIKGFKRFHVTLTIPSLNMESTSTDIKINGVAVSRINAFALRKHGSQILNHLLSLESAYAELVTLNTLNSFDIKDFLFLKGEQTATGYLTFDKVFSKDILLSSINTLSTDDFVIVDAQQDIKDLKVLSSFKASKIVVQGELNSENLDEFYGKIISKDGDETLNKKSVIQSTIVIEGNLFCGFVNGVVDIDRLVTNTVTASTEQSLPGSFTFIAPVSIFENLRVRTLNDIDLNSLVTLHTDQTIHGAIGFNTIDMERDLTVDLVNGYKLRDSAVLLTTDPQFIEGLVTFTSLLRVDDIDMSEFVTLDDVDPSLLAQDIVRHEEGIVTLNRTAFDNVVVAGDLTVSGGVNGFLVSDLPELVWLKSRPQEINVPVHVVKMSTENIEEVNEVNKLHLDTDFVHTYGDEPIVSSKTFSEKTEITSFNTYGGTMINGFDVTTFNNELDYAVKEGTIIGKKTFDSLEVNTGINVDALNEISLTDFMLPEAEQRITGQIEFPSEFTLIPEDLKVRNVDFHTFNNKNFESQLTKAVLKTNLKDHTISNKHFSSLTAQNLIFDEGSTLQGSSFDEMLRRIVTLNTTQDISSSKEFSDAVYILQPSVAMKINGLELSSLLNDVVFIDKEGTVPSKKTFTGTVQGEDFLMGLVNEIDVLRMRENAFLKAQSNVLPMMTFTSGLKIGSLTASSYIDEVSVSDLVMLNKDERLQFLYLPNIAVSNLWINGLLDDCDLTEMEKKSLYVSTLSQRIPEDVTIKSIQVIGNLYIDSVVNDIPMQNIKEYVITLDGDQVVSSNIVLGPNWRARNINIKNNINGKNLQFLISDAVKHSVLQDIKGRKNFNDVKTNVLEAENLDANLLEGVNVDELYRNAVLKATEQTIGDEKIFSSLKADVVTVTGFLNGLRLPEDVILTATTEHITSPTTFESILVLASNFVVEGKINQVALRDFVDNRVTLRGDESIRSSLSFGKDVDVKGDMIIDGAVNDIVLEMVARRRDNTPLDGEKEFTNLLLIGNLTSKAINGYDLGLLDTNILRSNKDGYIGLEQVFMKLKAGNLEVQSVNKIPLQELPVKFFSSSEGFNRKWERFDDLSSSVVRNISNQLQMFESQVTHFGYFALVQEINLGPASKILYSRNGYTHSLVAWISQRQCSYMQLCCDQELSQWLKVERNGKIVPEHGPSQGRFYPLNDPTSTMVDSNFVVWTNWTKSQPKWCDKTEGSMFLASYSHSGFFEGVLNIINAPLLSEIKTFRERHLYAVAGFHYDRTEDYYMSSTVYKFHEVAGWSEHQILPSYGALSLDITQVTYYGIRELLLAIGTGTYTHSSVYKWNEEDHKFGLLQHIPSKYVTSTLWVKESFNQLLVLANVDKWPKRGENCIDLVSGGEINVYIYEGKLTWIQSIPLQGVVSMLTFSLKGETFLVAASGQLQTINVYEWRGYSGFGLVQSMFVGEVRHLSHYILDNDFYMTVAIESGPSKVMKIILQGNNFQAVSYKEDPVVYLDQQDEATHDVKPGC